MNHYFQRNAIKPIGEKVSKKLCFFKIDSRTDAAQMSKFPLSI